MRTPAIALASLLAFVADAGVAAPPSILTLGEVSIGAARAAIEAKFGTSTMTGMRPDALEFHVYPIDPATNSYMLVEYATVRPDYAMSVQYTGPARMGEASIHGIANGATEAEALRVLGAPSKRTPEPDIGAELWAYDGRNYTLEVKSGRVSSIRVSGYEGWLERWEWPRNWNRYRVSSMAAELTKLRKEGGLPAASALKAKETILFVHQVEVRARVSYSGTMRPLTVAERKLIGDYAMSSMGSRNHAGRFSRCAVVVEQSRERCIALQDSFAGNFESEVGAGGTVDMFVILAGVNVEFPEGLFFANEFQTYQVTPLLATPAQKDGR